MDFSAQMTRFHNAKRKLFDKLYDHLNERQREAVFSVNGPLLVLAGAGTGKTTVLVNRISHIIKYGNAYYDETPVEGMTDAEISAMESAVSLPDDEIAAILGDFVTSPCPPWNILCFTFTNKAANEMKERLGRALGEDIASEIWAGTFHSICVRLLRRFGSSLGYNEHFTIYDTDDTKKAIADCLHKLNIDDKILPVKYVMKEISRLKDSLKSPSDYSKEVGNDSRKRYVQLVYTLYQKTLLEASALDFDDIIVQTVNLLSTNEEAASYCRNKFRYISVDEFQDTNYAQLRLIELLSEGRRNLMVVGDDDQSIYKFRGATIANILNFDRQFSDAKVVKLEENYRSTSNILDAANGIISHNVGRHQKSLFTKAGEGDKITVQICENQNEEARYIVNEITRNILSKKLTYSDFAVLYRMNSQSNSIESVLKRSGIPYRLIGGTRFYDRKEIKDIMAYLSVVNNPADNLRLKRIINEPKRKIGEKLISDIELIAAANGVSMFDVIDSAELYPQIVRSAGRLKEFANLIKELRNIMETEPLSVLFDRTIELSGYREMLLLGGDEEKERLDNVEELVSNAVQFETERENPSLSDFLEETSLVADIDNYDESGNAVVLMTVHSAKGLEFPVVFIPGFEENIFPSKTAVDEGDIEEERRLAYVAVTRAKRKLYVISARDRLMFGRIQSNQTSRFVDEMPGGNVVSEEGFGTFTPRRQPEKKKPFTSRELSAPSSIISQPKAAVSIIPVGSRVRHAVFGEGTIMSAKPVGADTMYEIAFDNTGTKKLMATFAKLVKI